MYADQLNGWIQRIARENRVKEKFDNLLADHISKIEQNNGNLTFSSNSIRSTMSLNHVIG